MEKGKLRILLISLEGGGMRRGRRWIEGVEILVAANYACCHSFIGDGGSGVRMWREVRGKDGQS